jgi:hypothetical protein
MQPTAARILAILAAATTLRAAAAFGQPSPPSIVVHLQSAGVIDGEHVLEAEARATRIFKAIGVSIRWVNDESTSPGGDRHGAFDASVTVLSAGATASFIANSSVPVDALGVTIVHTTHAYVFGERIRYVAGSRQDVPVLFGRVLAHEIGHLVLPGAGHSDVGIMRADLSKAGGPVIDPGFTASQGESIRGWLSSRRMLDLVSNGRSGPRPLETN